MTSILYTGIYYDVDLWQRRLLQVGYNYTQSNHTAWNGQTRQIAWYPRLPAKAVVDKRVLWSQHSWFCRIWFLNLWIVQLSCSTWLGRAYSGGRRAANHWLLFVLRSTSERSMGSITVPGSRTRHNRSILTTIYHAESWKIRPSNFGLHKERSRRLDRWLAVTRVDLRNLRMDSRRHNGIVNKT